jgi:hypothetical protein
MPNCTSAFSKSAWAGTSSISAFCERENILPKKDFSETIGCLAANTSRVSDRNIFHPDAIQIRKAGIQENFRSCLTAFLIKFRRFGG